MDEGWKCPNCGKAHGPMVQTCPEPATPDFRSIVFTEPAHHTGDTGNPPLKLNLTWVSPQNTWQSHK